MSRSETVLPTAVEAIGDTPLVELSPQEGRVALGLLGQARGKHRFDRVGADGQMLLIEPHEQPVGLPGR